MHSHDSSVDRPDLNWLAHSHTRPGPEAGDRDNRTITETAPVFHLRPVGRFANMMIEYMVALKFRDLVPSCRISGISLPAWGIEHPAIASPGPVAIERHDQRINLAALAARVGSGEIRRVEWGGFGQRMEQFLPVELYREVFVAPASMRRMGYGPGDLVCPVRAEDILLGPSPFYPLTPVEFYQDFVASTGLTPVFIGQTDPNAYTDRLRAAFPTAHFRAPQADPMIDFETIRQSRHIAVGVSTYAWLAAWLSETAETIFMAVSGLFNPMQQPQVDLLPFGDARFRFVLFPINYPVPLDRHAEAHRRIAPYWREMPHEALSHMMRNAPRFPPRLDQALEVFDQAFYLDENSDVAAVARHQGAEFGRAHFMFAGYTEGRAPLRFDTEWYAATYPIAAFEVAQGDHRSFLDHYIAVGRYRGYRPCPRQSTH